MHTPGGIAIAVLALRRPPFWSAGLLAATALTVALGLGVATDLMPRLWRGESILAYWQSVFFFLVVASATVSVLVRRAYARTRPLAPMSFHDTYFTLPLNAEAFGARTVAYADVLGFSVRGGPFRPQLLIESRQHLFLYGGDAFVEPQGMQLAVELLRQQISSQPRGQIIFEQMDQRRTLAHAALLLRPIATQALLGLMVVFFANEMLTGALQTWYGLLSWGADAPILVRRGELFRLVAANFLHADPVHIFFDGLALYYLGMVLERLLGHWRFLLVFLISGLAATSASAYAAQALYSVGSSGAVFGLLGSLAVVNFRYRTQLPLGFRQPLRWWIFVLAINAALPILWPRIDVVAHVTGFVVGSLLTLAFVITQREMRPARPTGRPLQAATVLVTLLYIVGLVQTVAYAARFDDAKIMETARILVDDQATDAIALNELAWRWATDKITSPELLELAQQAAERAVHESDGEPAIRDTLATVLYRRGALDAAIDEQRAVLAAAPDVGDYASQLLRFLETRAKKTGHPKLAPEVARRRVSVSLQHEPQPRVLLRVGQPDKLTVEVLALVREGGSRLGLLEIVTSIATTSQTIDLGPDIVRTPGWSSDATLLLLSVRAVERAASQRYWPMEPAIDVLP